MEIRVLSEQTKVKTCPMSDNCLFTDKNYLQACTGIYTFLLILLNNCLSCNTKNLGLGLVQTVLCHIGTWFTL